MSTHAIVKSTNGMEPPSRLPLSASHEAHASPVTSRPMYSSATRASAADMLPVPRASKRSNTTCVVRKILGEAYEWVRAYSRCGDSGQRTPFFRLFLKVSGCQPTLVWPHCAPICLELFPIVERGGEGGRTIFPFPPLFRQGRDKLLIVGPKFRLQRRK